MRSLLLVALVGSAAQASRILPNPGDGERIRTPFGEMLRLDARSLCAGKTVYIGVTEDAVTYQRPEKGGGSRIRTQLTVRVERRLVGNPGSFSSLDAAGGEIDGKKVWPGAGPQPEVGLRYLVASVPMLADAPPQFGKGDPFATVTHPMDPAAPLDSNDELAAALDALCERGAFSRYADAVRESASTP